jgi:uncharacterized protein
MYYRFIVFSISLFLGSANAASLTTPIVGNCTAATLATCNKGVVVDKVVDNSIEQPKPVAPAIISVKKLEWCGNGSLSATESTICNDAELSALDNQLNNAYKQAKKSARAGQKEWLTTRDGLNSKEDLKALYKERIAQLSAPWGNKPNLSVDEARLYQLIKQNPRLAELELDMKIKWSSAKRNTNSVTEQKKWLEKRDKETNQEKLITLYETRIAELQ